MGIPSAPRGIPQIEVTFDIDANGIVNVSAKDLGTGTEQSIKIESQTSLSEDEIKQKVEDAEKFAEEDKRRKAKVEMRNTADSVVYQTRKMIEEAGDKLSEEALATIAARIQGGALAVPGGAPAGGAARATEMSYVPPPPVPGTAVMPIGVRQ